MQKPDTANGITAASPHTLIGLAHAARKLSLDPKKIRSRMSDIQQSRFKGRGMEYDESRLYQPGDDIRHLDWRVTARSGKTYTKTFQEERERPVFLWADYRPSMFFATRGKFKSVVAAEIAALLGWAASLRGDRVGGAIFFGEDHREVKPLRGRIGMLRFIHRLSEWSDRENGESEDSPLLSTPLRKMGHIVHPGSLVILVSDFRGCDDKAQNYLRKLGSHNELVMIQVYDPLEEQLPPPGNYRVTDSHSEWQFTGKEKALRASYQQKFIERSRKIRHLSRKIGAVYLKCRTDEKPLSILQKAFATR